jgi:hypothetical protein
MAATLDQVIAALDGAHAKLDTLAGQVATANSKLDTLLPEMRLVMSLQDDLAAATATLQDETATLIDSNRKLGVVLASLKAAVAANQPVDPAVVAQFEAALGQHQGAVDNIAALANPAEPPAG